MMTASEAKSLGAIARQVRGLLSGIDRLPDAFDEIESLELRLDVAKKEYRQVDADTVKLKEAYRTLDQDFQSLQQQYATADTAHQARKEALESTLSAAQADLLAVQQLKRETEAQLSSLTAAWSLKSNQPIT